MLAWRLALLVLAMAAVTPGWAVSRGEQVVAGFTHRMQRLAGVNDVRCRSTVVLQIGNDKLTQVLRVAAKRPDKLRMDVISSTIPMITGWTYIRNGEHLVAYDPISERTVSLDIANLTDRHPMRLDNSFSLPAAMFDPGQFTIRYRGRRQSPGRDREVVELRPKREFAFGPHTIARVEFELHPQTLLPLAENAWDRRGRRVFAATFSEPKLVAPGLLANLRMDLVQAHARATIRFQWLGHALLPVSMELADREQKGRLVVTHRDFVLDKGIADKEFALP